MSRIAVSYLRTATPNRSIEEQRQLCTRFAVKKGYRLVSEFADEGVSGMTLDRPALNVMRRKLIGLDVDVLLVVSMSRLSRSEEHLRILLQEFRTSNISIELVQNL